MHIVPDNFVFLKIYNFFSILFNFRTAHTLYFNEKSIKFFLKKAGIKKYKINYYHEMDFSNLLVWLKDKKTQLWSRPVTLRAMSNEVQSFPPKARVY